MSTERRTEVIPASGQVTFGPGNFFFLTGAGASVDISFQRDGTTFGATGMQSGYVKKEVRAWQMGTITGPAGTTVVFIFGYEEVTESDTDFRQVIVSTAPSAALGNLAPVTVNAGATTQIFATNSARRRVTVTPASANTDSGFLRNAAGGQNIKELQPGSSYELQTTGAAWVNNPSGTNQVYYLTEET